MSFRRFVYLVTDDVSRRNFPLRRMDMSRFFLPRSKSNQLLLTDPPPPPTPLEEEQAEDLPPAAIAFDPPTSIDCNEDMEFMLFPGGGDTGRNDKVAATDLTGRVILYDPESHSVRSAPGFATPKFAPISVAAGDASYYALDTDFIFNNRAGCFDRIFHGGAGDDWRCQSLPPPPYVYSAYLPGGNDTGSSWHVDAYVVGGGGGSSSIWISQTNLGTHCFDTASRVWTKAGDWALPFSGHVQYEPEHKLWFGFPSADACDEDDAGSVYAADLAVAPPPMARRVWADDVTALEWTGKSSCLVHLGCSRFCHATFFMTKQAIDLVYRSYVLFTGLEVVSVCGDGGGGGEVRMVKHRSRLYRLVNKVRHSAARSNRFFMTHPLASLPARGGPSDPETLAAAPSPPPLLVAPPPEGITGSPCGSR
ncbi:unnamed protein product [Urochloa humidicola]